MKKKLLSVLLCLCMVLTLLPTVAQAADTPDGCISFSSASSFTVAAQKKWNGTLEYSTDGSTWLTWSGSTVTAAQNGGSYYLYFRGTGNRYFTSSTLSPGTWTITGTAVACSGNIETLLDYNTVAGGGHPLMNSYCFYKMFYNCTALTTAPTLPATKLAKSCYNAMFTNCKALTTAPELPATTLQEQCYYMMFDNCTSLTTAPALPATTLAIWCYDNMFCNCKTLTSIPELPATILPSQCYYQMFLNCGRIKLTTTDTGHPALLIPSDATVGTDSLKDMFYYTGSDIATPVKGTQYYYKEITHSVALNTSTGVTAYQYSTNSTNGTDGSWQTYSTPVIVDDGASLYIKAIPASGYAFDGWTDGVTDNPRQITNIQTNYILTPTVSVLPIASADIAWGTMEFTYNEGTWHPESHSFTGGWACSTDANKITVTNTGEVAFQVTYGYTQTDTAFTASFRDGANAPISSTIPLATAGTTTAYLSLSGTPTDCFNLKKLGSVTVTIN